MKSNPIIAVVIGLVLLLIGGFMQFSGTAPTADPELTVACRAEISQRGGDEAFADQCSDKSFAVAMTATDAQSAAKAISASNSQDVGANAISMFMLGLGLVLFFGGIAMVMKKRKVGAAPPSAE